MEKSSDPEVVTIAQACRLCVTIRAQYTSEPGCLDEGILRTKRELLMYIESFRQLACKELGEHSGTRFEELCTKEKASGFVRKRLRSTFQSIQKRSMKMESVVTGGTHAAA